MNLCQIKIFKMQNYSIKKL